MARYKSTPDPRGGHIRLYWDLYDSNAWRCLSATDQRCYMALARQLKGSNNGDLCLTLSVAKSNGVKSPATLAKSLRALVAVGLIAVTRKGGSTMGGQRLPTLYRLTDRVVYEMPAKFIDAYRATNEWREIKTLAQGRAAIRKAEEAAASIEATKKNQLQLLAPTTSKNEVVGAKTTSKNEVWTPAPIQKMKLEESRISTSESNNCGAFGERGEELESESHTSKTEHLYIVTKGYDANDGHDAGEESVSAVQRFQAGIGVRLAVPARNTSLGRTRHIRLFKAALASMGAVIPTPAAIGH